MKKLMKILAVVLAGSVLGVPVMASTIGLNINGTTVKTTVAPYQLNGTTLVPLRVVSENLGANVGWNQKEQKVTINQGSTTIDLTLGSKIAKVNGKAKTLNLSPQIKNNTTMVPIRFVSENLNCDVNWDSKTQVVSVTGKSETQVNEDGTIIVKNPIIFAGVPSVSVEWLEKNLEVTIKYYEQYNRYSMTSKDRMGKFTISEKAKWVSINSAIEPFKGDFDCGTNKSNSKISIDIVSKAYGYKWTYDKETKTLTLTRVKEDIPMQEPVNGYVTVKGYAKFLDTLKPASKMPIIIYTRTATGAIGGINELTTDENGYYEYNYEIPQKQDVELYTLEIQCINEKYRGVTPTTSHPENGESKQQSYLRETMPIIYVKNK